MSSCAPTPPLPPPCCCCVSPWQARDIEESRYMFDQLAVVSPIMLALSAATPIHRWGTRMHGTVEREAQTSGRYLQLQVQRDNNSVGAFVLWPHCVSGVRRQLLSVCTFWSFRASDGSQKHRQSGEYAKARRECRCTQRSTLTAPLEGIQLDISLALLRGSQANMPKNIDMLERNTNHAVRST